MSEGEAGQTINNAKEAVEELPMEETTLVVNMENYSWRGKIKLPAEQQNCEHYWTKDSVDGAQYCCMTCKERINPIRRMTCTLCKLVVCLLCAQVYYKVKVQTSDEHKRYIGNKDLLIKELCQYVDYLITENEKLQKAIEQQIQKEAEEVIAASERIAFWQEEQILKVAEAPKPKRVINKLYNLMVEFEIPGVQPFEVQAIIDTGATSCCLNIDSVPKEALEVNPYVTHFSGINASKQEARWKLKYGLMKLGENKFRIPLVYAFDMNTLDGIQMLVGCNFIRAMYGGLRIEGNTLTFYKNVTSINTSEEAKMAAAAIEELEMDEPEYLATQEMVFLNTGGN